MQTLRNDPIHRLSIAGKEIILIGTAHVSKESTRLVQEVIGTEIPDTVCVELCESRNNSIQQKDRWLNTDIFQVIKEKKAFVLLSNLILASFQKRIADKLDVKPGEEMIKAMESANLVGAHICLADRDIRITLTRAWRMMGLWDKLKVLVQLIMSIGQVDELSEEDVEKMKQEDILEAFLTDVEKSLPMIRKILIDERDQYLAYKIKHAPGNKIVAVMGAGHITGIKEWLVRDTDIPIEPLETIPSPRLWTRSLKWIIPAAIVALIVSGFFYGGSSAGTGMIVAWIVANGMLAGIGASIALGHPLTIISAAVAAPLTSINPMIAAGWVSGLVEAFSRKPLVQDFERLSEDILSIKGFWKNKVTRVLLVVVFTNLGSIVGTFVAIPLMIKLLH